MRLWSLHPRHLDAKGLVALWREALLAQAVLGGGTKGYRNHPQLARFRAQASPLASLGAYLQAVHAEAQARGYAFDAARIQLREPCGPIPVTEGQLAFEWRHLLAKLAVRDPGLHARALGLAGPACHPLFQVVPGPVEDWERGGEGPG